MKERSSIDLTWISVNYVFICSIKKHYDIKLTNSLIEDLEIH